MTGLSTLVAAFWAMLPSYLPNNAAVLLGGGPPLDGGREWNGERLLGDGKTWRGTAGGILVGTLAACGLNRVADRIETTTSFSLPRFPLRAGVALAAGAMFGDVVGSFLKRRSGRDRGAMAPGLDQLDFVAGSLAFARLVAPAWFGRTFTRPAVAVVLVVTPLLHVGTNVAAYLLGLKDEPW
ncbi:CDP-2,3-bis-(O-geranylgeranyl)-sn-glycerol synthase [Halomarina oriensis]|uniref:CDP-archaeol synthase n=1 Tax=Halomarina oriensis TaxID=671145 RepID=A0A6B0GMN8_9EURY|nr:CDP-2,3-bis-(O-geranylgeranyl)-sn-glycerol synthase [Halomarina oriensis]MWG34749.1 CDP-2,3-bis-(O-geranylgeranyl)-sn-glycerol synthase [Halomarina oriensis]